MFHNVFLHGIVTATIAADGGDPKHAVSILGGRGVSVCDLTLIVDGDEGVKVDDCARDVRIEDIECRTFREWCRRK